jgi:hypothetical protein
MYLQRDLQTSLPSFTQLDDTVDSMYQNNMSDNLSNNNEME